MKPLAQSTDPEIHIHPHRQDRIRAELIVIVQIFIAHARSVVPLRHPLLGAVFDPSRISIILETSGEPFQDPRPFLPIQRLLGIVPHLTREREQFMAQARAATAS